MSIPGIITPSITLAPPSPTLSQAPSTAATSLRPSIGPAHNDTHKRTASDLESYAPPASTSEYAWHKTSADAANGKRYWYRRQDTMGDFCLHWQKRFHGHGDMYATGLLYEKSVAGPSTMIPADVNVHHVRETMRRLRSRFPFVAVELVKRSEYGIDPLTNIPKFVEKNVDLQVAITYEIVETDEDVDHWLDRLVIVHNEPRTKESAEDPEQKEYIEFVAHVTRTSEFSNRLKVHFWPGSKERGVPPRLTLEQCHNTSDGIGVLLLYDDMLTVLAEVMADPAPAPIRWGAEVCHLPESLQDATAVQHETWTVSKDELKEIDRINGEKLNGKTTPPNFIDRIGNKVVALTQRNNSKGWFRRKVLNKPLVGLCRKVAQAGDMLPLGLLPQSSAKYEGEYGGTGVLMSTLSPNEARALLSTLKRKQLTAAPLLEAAMHMATTWVRRERGLASDAKTGYDTAGRVLGSFSNAVDRRNTLREDQQRYHGLCLGGLPTKVGAGEVRWSQTAHASARPSQLDARDRVPGHVDREDLETLERAARVLAQQYEAGKTDPNWIRFGKATMFGTMETEFLFLTNENHYPSMPWLSSVGRLDSKVAPSRKIPRSPTSSEEATATLEVVNLRMLGRMGIRQPILHIYSHRGEMTMHLSYADWYYDRKGAIGRRVHRCGKPQKGDEHERDQSILQLWFEVYRQILVAFVAENAETAGIAAA
ncbi:hypothetical protein ACQY0O_003763 [Thecaphora frezii]